MSLFFFFFFFGDSNDETNFPLKLLLTYTPISRICKAFENGSSANIKISKTLLLKMVELGGFLTLFGPLGLFSEVKMINPIANSYAKELKNMNPEDF